MKIVCISCKKNVANLRGTVKFKCPNCNKFEIVRCKNCRETAAPYECPECNFIGPN